LALTLDDLQLVLLNFIATLSGVFTAFLLTAIYDRMKKREQEREDRRRMLIAIQKELQVNLEFLSLLQKNETYSAGQIFLWRDAYQSAVNSGKTALFDPKLQSQLGTLYLTFKQLDVYGAKVLAMLGTPETKESKVVFAGTILLMKQSVETALTLIPRGLEVLENELRQLESWSPVGEPAVTQGPNLDTNRDIDLLKINLAADYRLGMLVAMTGVYFALIVGLLVAWYQRYPDNLLGYYVIAGLFGSLLITQELLPYKRWLRHVDEWLRMVESNQRIPNLTKLVLQRDGLKSSGQAMLIFLFLLDFYLTLLGNSSVQLFVEFSAAGVAVVFLTQGGVDLIRQRRS